MRFSTSLACLCFVSASGFAHAQTVSAQSASISGTSGSIVATRVPVQIGTGTPSYFDVTIILTAAISDGKATGVTVAGTSAASQVIQTRGFQAGTYIDSVNNVYA